jgi:hypothetical protein
MTNNPISKIKKLLKLKSNPPFAIFSEEILKGGGAFTFYLIQTNAQIKAQVTFKPKRVHLLKDKKQTIIPVECLLKECPACIAFTNKHDLKYQFKGRFLYHVATTDQRFLLIDAGSNLHNMIQNALRLCIQNNINILNNPELAFCLSEDNNNYKLDIKETLDHTFSGIIQNNIDYNITLSEDKYLKLKKEEMLDLIDWTW